MRSPAILSLVLLCGLALPAHARLFWQTYGSVVPTADGGCTWNTNSDYFVPRHCDTCRYGLYSPCKVDCTTSPACRRCHALYPGYCSPYGCFHYCWRNRVYGRKCGCCPVPYNGPYRPGCGLLLCQRGCRGCGACSGGACSQSQCSDGMCSGGAMYDGGCFEGDDYSGLENIESSKFQILGSISLTGDPLLTSLQLGSPGMGMPLLPGQALPGQVMPGQQPLPPQSYPNQAPAPRSPPQALPLFGNSSDVEFLPGPEAQLQQSLPSNEH